MFWLNNYHVQICRCLHASMLMYNSFSMYYLGNTVEIFFKKKKDMLFFLNIFFCNEVDANFLHMY